jgi:hypothetical protein
MSKNYFFTSDMFQVHADETDETNPGCYGRELGEWLCGQLKEAGYETELIPEDWGWCVMCISKPYMLWIGCWSELRGSEDEDYDWDRVPDSSEILWQVSCQLEIPFFYLKAIILKAFGKLDTKTPVLELEEKLAGILSSEPRIRLQPEP